MKRIVMLLCIAAYSPFTRAMLPPPTATAAEGENGRKAVASGVTEQKQFSAKDIEGLIQCAYLGKSSAFKGTMFEIIQREKPGITINSKDAQGRTFLHAAIQGLFAGYTNECLIKEFVAKGADTSIPLRVGDKTLDLSQLFDHYISEKIIRINRDPIFRDQITRVRNFLLGQNAKPNNILVSAVAKGAPPKSALAKAKSPVSKALPKPTAKKVTIRDPFFIAALKGDAATFVKLLGKDNARINDQDSSGLTALHLALESYLYNDVEECLDVISVLSKKSKTFNWWRNVWNDSPI